MALRLATRQVTLALVLLWLGAVALTAGMVATDGHAMAAPHLAPAAILTAILVAWPFALGWRPFVPRHRRMRSCPACGTQWRPADEGTSRCPACDA